MFERMFIRAALLGAVTFIAGSSLRAEHQIQVNGPTQVMAGTSVEWEIRATQDSVVDESPRLLKINASTDIRIDPQGPKGLVLKGPSRFALFFSPQMRPGPYVVKLTDSRDRSLFAQVSVVVEPAVASFELTPLRRPFVGKDKEPFDIQLVARSSDGAVVRSFASGVSLSVSSGKISPSWISGASFYDGIARVSVTVSDRDVLVSQIKLNARSAGTSAGAQEGSATLSFRGSSTK